MHRQIGTVKLDNFIIIWVTVYDRYQTKIFDEPELIATVYCYAM